MVKNIHSLAQLRLEIERLATEQQFRENQLRILVKDYANSFKPANLLKSAFSSISGDPEIKGVLKSKGVESVIGFVVSQLLFKHSNPIVRTAISLLGTTIATNVFGNQSTKYMEKIKNLYRKFRSRRASSNSGLFNEEDIYSV